MVITIYRSGRIPTFNMLQTESALAFDADCASFRPADGALRADSIFGCLSLEEAETWADWRISLDLDADIWAIHLKDDVEVYAHPVKAYEDARLRVYPEYATKGNVALRSYWDERILATPNTVLPEGRWEVLLPADIFVHSTVSYEMVKENHWWKEKYAY